MRFTVLPAVLLAATATSQDKVDVRIDPADQAVRYTILSRSETATDREFLVDGEPMEARGGFGGGGTVKTEATVEFDEGREGSATWRIYRKANAKVDRPDRDGETRSDEIEGGMIGERLHIIEDDRGVVVRRGDAEGDELPPMFGLGMAARTSFAGITPSEAVAIDAEFELPPKFLAALNSLMHPVRPAIDPDAAGGGRGGEGAERGARGRGRGRFAGGGMGAFVVPPDTTLPLLANAKLEGKIVGQVVEVADGIAKIELRGTREGAGSLGDIGLAPMRGRGGFGGRAGGRGGFGPEFDGRGSATVVLEGVLRVDTRTHALVELVLEGTSKTTSEIKLRRDREIETTSRSDGTFRYSVAARTPPEEPAGGDDR